MRIPKIETLLIVVIFISIALWGVSKCTSKSAEVQRKVRAFQEAGAAEEEAARERPMRVDTPQKSVAPAPVPAVTTTPAPTVATTQTPVSTSGPNPAPAVTAPTTAKPANPASGKQYSTLYVTIDQLNVRKKPGLEGDLVAKLKLHEQVYFLNEKTDWTQEISLGKEKVTDHWVRIRTKNGKEGWVFGAGVHYYKMKHPGAAN